METVGIDDQRLREILIEPADELNQSSERPRPGPQATTVDSSAISARTGTRPGGNAAVFVARQRDGHRAGLEAGHRGLTGSGRGQLDQSRAAAQVRPCPTARSRRPCPASRRSTKQTAEISLVTVRLACAVVGAGESITVRAGSWQQAHASVGLAAGRTRVAPRGPRRDQPGDVAPLNPASMFTTVTFAAQLLSMLSSAAMPPKFAP